MLAMHEGREGEIVRVEPAEFQWGRKEAGTPQSWVIVQVGPTLTTADDVRELLAIPDTREPVLGEPEWDDEPAKRQPVQVHERKWRFRLSEVDGAKLDAAATTGTFSLTEEEFEAACESQEQRRRFDRTQPDGQGELWPDHASPMAREESVTERRDRLADEPTFALEQEARLARIAVEVANRDAKRAEREAMIARSA